MLKIDKGVLKEIGYGIKDEAKLGSIFGVGNGYFGIRGSFEELGDVFIQGTYIRGVFDQIVEIPNTFCDNLYMKQYYFDVQKLKEFELEDSCINVCDPLTIRFYVGDKMYLPYEGKTLKWKRYIDFKTGGLVRETLWDDGEGHINKLKFFRVASFGDNHIILQEASVERVNHNLPVRIELGVDTLVKTNGQHKSVLQYVKNEENTVMMRFHMGNKYNHEVALRSRYEVENASYVESNELKGVYYSAYNATANKVTVRKVTSMYASVDPVSDFVTATDSAFSSYTRLYKEHLKAYREAFRRIDVQIKGDDECDALLRYANYQTLIGFDRYDSVHSLSAKNLTAEKYNQFVWWDAEIFQLPAVIATFPEAARSCLEYRYRCLGAAKEIAAQDGYKGAKYAFCSSVKGDENVWIYARHPFLQIHISGDIAYGVYNYYRQTLDKEFLLDKGLEMMVETMEYFHSRSTKKNGQLHLLNVTGTDEHHPYVDNDAYTNFEVKFLARETLRLAKQFDYTIDSSIQRDIEELRDNLFVPVPSEKGIIPQFDGYLNLKTYLPLDGNGAATGFQMKASGLYHLSQIIKQPDVLNLYSYLDVDMPKDIYKANWRYYYKMCEASSSLTYPVHAICAMDFGEKDLFRKNFVESLTIDIADLHNCAYQGVHAGCLAGGWFNIYRGVFGIHPHENGLYIEPQFKNPFKSVSMNFIYQGNEYHAEINAKKVIITSAKEVNINIYYKGNAYKHSVSTELLK